MPAKGYSSKATISQMKVSPPIISTNSHRYRPIQMAYDLKDGPGGTERVEMNKIFVSAWLDPQRVVVGTKCSRLVVIDAVAGRVACEIPPVTGFWAGSRFVQGSTRALAPHRHSTLRSSERDSILESLDMYSQSADSYVCTGIHGIAINPSRTLLAVAAGHPIETIQVYRLPDLTPHAVLRTHSDMVFAIQFLDDVRLISGGRDARVCCWDLSTPESAVDFLYPTVDPHDRPVMVFRPVAGNFKYPVATPDPTVGLATGYIGRLISGVIPAFARAARAHPDPAAVGIVNVEDKVRDLRVYAQGTKFAALATKGVVKLFDVARGEAQSSECFGILPKSDDIVLCAAQRKEAVCMEVAPENPNTLVVGSQSHVSFFDTRSKTLFASARSLDCDWGVRSLAFDVRGVLAVGGGMGRISFLDIRMRDYVEWTDHTTNSARQWLELDAGEQSLARDAVYTLSYCPLGVRLFAGGGPLQLNMKGCRSGIWC
ncbi:hypothetical protein HDU84_003509 [Entophlyctis sp. JEL0112]|nr:hypothetical protein HDU84_003509 [Entophlyctis sp. JEL0112]